MSQPMPQNLPHQTIEIRVEEVAQLFNTLDPFPFKERDLDSDAEEYIVGWARELPRERPLQILIHLPAKEAETKGAQELEEALARFFAYRADVLGRDLNELLRMGRRSILIGVSALGLCLTVGRLVTGRFGPDYLGRFVEEGLIIVGWVANWRPIEIFLYDWWPLARRRIYIDVLQRHRSSSIRAGSQGRNKVILARLALNSRSPAQRPSKSP